MLGRKNFFACANVLMLRITRRFARTSEILRESAMDFTSTGSCGSLTTHSLLLIYIINHQERIHCPLRKPNFVIPKDGNYLSRSSITQRLQQSTRRYAQRTTAFTWGCVKSFCLTLLQIGFA